MAYVAIGIVVLVGILYLAGVVLAGMASAADSASTGLSEFIARTLGRKSLGMTASIPEELQEGESPIPKHDPDKEALNSCKPEPSLTRIPGPVAFKRPTPFRSPTEPTREIDIDRIREILGMPEFRTYEAAFSIISEEPSYPEALPPSRRPSSRLHHGLHGSPTSGIPVSSLPSARDG